MALAGFQEFLSNLVSRQRSLFSGAESSPIDELLDKLMSSVGEVSGIVTARQVLDHYEELDEEEKLAFFQNLEQSFNADPHAVRAAYQAYETEPNSANLNKLSSAAEPRRVKLLRRLNQTPGATHDLVAMRRDLLQLLRKYPELKSVDADFLRVFKSWFGRGFLQLRTIDWSTSAAILERIIRYEAVHAIRDWDDLRSRIDPPNRRCFAFFHPALVDEPLIFVEVALLDEVPGDIGSILRNESAGEPPRDYKVAAFYSISNCQPGLKNVSFGNFLIKQVVQELNAEMPSLKTFVTLSPLPGFVHWLNKDIREEPVALADLKSEAVRLYAGAENGDGDGGGLNGQRPQATRQSESGQKNGQKNGQSQRDELLRKCVFNYLMVAKRGRYPRDPVERFHLGNGASLHQIHTGADLSERGMSQSLGCMVNYLYDPKNIERNHEQYASEGVVEFNDKLKSLQIKP